MKTRDQNIGDELIHAIFDTRWPPVSQAILAISERLSPLRFSFLKSPHVFSPHFRCIWKCAVIDGIRSIQIWDMLQRSNRLGSIFCNLLLHGNSNGKATNQLEEPTQVTESSKMSHLYTMGGALARKEYTSDRIPGGVEMSLGRAGLRCGLQWQECTCKEQ